MAAAIVVVPSGSLPGRTPQQLLSRGLQSCSFSDAAAVAAAQPLPLPPPPASPLAFSASAGAAAAALAVAALARWRHAARPGRRPGRRVGFSWSHLGGSGKALAGGLPAERLGPGSVLSPRSVGLITLAANPEPGETAKFLGADKDIPRHRAFNFLLWDAHRKNPDRYINWTTGLLSGSTVVARLAIPVGFLSVFSAAVVAYDTLLVPQGFIELTLPEFPFTITASALSLLLVFRVNNSNARYNESREIWGNIVNVSRDLMQQAERWDLSRRHFYEFASWTSTFPAALMCHLRRPEEHSLKEELNKALGAQGDLTSEDIEGVLSRPAGVPAPLLIAENMRALIKKMDLDTMERLEMEMNMSKLVADVGACERILSTPIPVAYTIHTARLLMLWLGLLPFATEGGLGVGAVFGETVLAFGLLGIEDVGITMEEPFCVLPLEAICNKIGRESRALRKAAREEDKEKQKAVEPQAV